MPRQKDLELIGEIQGIWIVEKELGFRGGVKKQFWVQIKCRNCAIYQETTVAKFRSLKLCTSCLGIGKTGWQFVENLRQDFRGEDYFLLKCTGCGALRKSNGKRVYSCRHCRERPAEPKMVVVPIDRDSARVCQDCEILFVQDSRDRRRVCRKCHNARWRHRDQENNLWRNPDAILGSINGWVILRDLSEGRVRVRCGKCDDPTRWDMELAQLETTGWICLPCEKMKNNKNVA